MSSSITNSLRTDPGSSKADPTQMPMSHLIANGDRSIERPNASPETTVNSRIIFPDASDDMLPLHNRTLPAVPSSAGTNSDSRSESSRASSSEATEGNPDTSVIGSSSVEPETSSSTTSLNTITTLNPSDSSLHSFASSSPSSASHFSTPPSTSPLFAATTPGPNPVADSSRPRDPRYNPTVGGTADLIKPIDLTNPNSASGSSGRPSSATDEHGAYPGSNNNNYPTNSGNYRPSSGNYPGNNYGNNNVGTNPSGSSTRQPGNSNYPTETGSGYPGSGNYPGSGSGYPGSGDYPTGGNYRPGYNRPGGYGNNYGKRFF